MRVATALTAGLVLLGMGTRPAAAGNDGTIGVYADLSATQPFATFAIGVPRTLFVIARLDGATASGTVQAEFRIDGMPDDWFVFVSPNPVANVVLGDPFRASGGVHRANIAFPSCTATSGRVLLYTVTVIANSIIEPRDLTVLAGDPPTNPNFTTPILVRCDPPEFTTVPAGGESFRMEVRAAEDLEFSPLPGYDLVRGVLPGEGLPGDLFHFRVVYSSAGPLPAAGSPWLELDANGDQDTDDAGEGRFSGLPADLDSTLSNGKEYRFDVALGEPPGGQYRYRFTAIDHLGAPVPGHATVWQDSLFVSADVADLGVVAEDIRIMPTHPNVGEACAMVARIENHGHRRLTDVMVRFEDSFGNLIAERTIASLGPFATTEVACTRAFTTLGFQPIVVRVDPNDEIPERSESNNVASHGVFVGGIGISGTLAITGLPAFVQVPRFAPFGFLASTRYVASGFPPVRGAEIVVQPDWDAPTSTRTDDTGAFAVNLFSGTPGIHFLTIVVSDGARSESATVQVNVLNGSPLPGPNLVVRLDWAPGTGCPASQAVLSAVVENKGVATAAATQVRILASDLSTVATVNVGPLAPSAGATLDPILAPIAGPGPHFFTAHVDPANTIRERREDDNVATAGGRTPSACFDLTLEAMRFTGTRICAEEALTVAAQVTNRSCMGSQPGRIAWLAGGGEIESATVPALAAGQSIEIPFAHTFPSPDCSDFEFVLDPEGATGSDCDATNNRLGAFACPGSCGPPPPPLLPNLTVASCELQASSSSPASGEAIRFSTTVRNVGPGNTTGPIEVTFDIGGTVLGAPIPIPSLPSGDSRVVEATTTWPASFAPQLLTVSIDTHGQPSTSPTAQRALPWDLRPLPIGPCPPANPAMFSTCAPCQGTPLTIRAVVVNDGLFDCDSVLVHFRDDRPGGGVLGSAWATDVLARSGCAGLNGPVEITHAFASTGPQSVQVVVDPLDALAEVDEANNTFARETSVNCTALPDLVARVRFPAGSVPAPLDTVRAVEVEVQNIGFGAAIDVQASLRLDGGLLCLLEMGTLAPGAANTVVCTTPWVVGTQCTQVLEACADPSSRIGESDEANNCGTGGFSASGETDLALYSQSIHIQPPNPLPGQQVLIEVDVFNNTGFESQCLVTAEYSFDLNSWTPIGFAPVHMPPSVYIFPRAFRQLWTTPASSLYLRFSLVTVCPHDENPENNVFIATLPWFVVPNTPVTVSDFAATSKPDGVLLQWSADDAVERFVLERRTSGGLEWERLPVSIVTETARGDWEALDRDAPPAVEIDYRLLALVSGEEEVAATFTVTHSAARREMQLHGVRPHPFRPGSTIEFTLPEARSVELGIFDAAGRRVRGLRRGSEVAGRHGVTWDGRDDQGARLPAGVYFCRLVAGSFAQTLRIVLVH